MAGKILKEVISTNDRGLIGFTQEGEEIPLSTPEPDFIRSSIPNGFFKVKEEKEAEEVLIDTSASAIEYLSKQVGEDKYIREGSWLIYGGELVTRYNIYKRRT